MIMAILSKSGRAPDVVYYGFNDHYWSTRGSLQSEMFTSVNETPKYWSGFDPAAFIGVRNHQAEAFAALTDAINQSSATDPLTIIEAGPAQVIGIALARSNPAARPFVTVISHSPDNDTHATTKGPGEGLAAPRYNFAALGVMGAQLVHIQDQNPGLNRPYDEFRWLRDSTDPKLHWLWDRGQAAGKSTFDCSDAGMAYFFVTGDPACTPGKLRTFFDQ